MIDVDLFKLFNDHLGHAEGDRCLEQVASALESALPRRIDFVGRYGGDEFVAFLPLTDHHGALAVAETMRAAVEALDIPAPFMPTGRVTVSQSARADAGAQVLLIAKSLDIQGQMANQLEAAGIVVCAAAGWAEALEASAGPNKDLIVLDAALLLELSPGWWHRMRGLT